MNESSETPRWARSRLLHAGVSRTRRRYRRIPALYHSPATPLDERLRSYGHVPSRAAELGRAPGGVGLGSIAVGARVFGDGLAGRWDRDPGTGIATGIDSVEPEIITPTQTRAPETQTLNGTPDARHVDELAVVVEMIAGNNNHAVSRIWEPATPAGGHGWTFPPGMKSGNLLPLAGASADLGRRLSPISSVADVR